MRSHADGPIAVVLGGASGGAPAVVHIAGTFAGAGDAKGLQVVVHTGPSCGPPWLIKPGAILGIGVGLVAGIALGVFCLQQHPVNASAERAALLALSLDEDDAILGEARAVIDRAARRPYHRVLQYVGARVLRALTSPTPPWRQ